MDSKQREIFKAIIIYLIIWNSQYIWEYLPGIFDLGIYLILLMTIILLLIVGIYQLFKYLTEQPRKNFRLINTGLIVLISVLSYYSPNGLIDFEKYEGENIVHATYEGVANCKISLKLKAGNTFKKTSMCFGKDHYWGKYEIVNDTIKFHYDRISKDNKEDDFAILQLEDDTIRKRLGLILYHSNGLSNGGLPMIIREINIDKLLK